MHLTVSKRGNCKERAEEGISRIFSGDGWEQREGTEVVQANFDTSSGDPQPVGCQRDYGISTQAAPAPVGVAAELSVEK